MGRTSVVIGSASGIGAATRDLLEQRGDYVIGVDVKDADVVADLSTGDGRTAMLDQVMARSSGRVDSVFAVAGRLRPAAPTVAVNYFGAIATVEGLRPLLLRSDSPRAVVVSSVAALRPVDEELMSAMDARDEKGSMRRATVLAGTPELGDLIYSSTKRALSLWVRRNAPGPAWAGASIPLNAVAPGVVDTRMTSTLIGDAESARELLRMVPMPLNGVADPRAVARVLSWLGSGENTHMCGQVVYVDGGADAVLRGDTVW